MSKEIFIAIRTGNGDGTRFNPFNGSTDSALDSVLLAAGTNTTIHFGPGLFRTKGHGGSASIVTARSGQRWIGSGIGSTILQLVGATPPPDTPGTPTSIVVVGSPGTLDGFEISDMTLDPNLSRQPKQSDPVLGWKNPPIKTDAVGLAGKNIRLRRLRIINWGTYIANFEGFPIYIVGWPPGAVGENIVEDCIIEQPDFSPAREVTLLNNHGEAGVPDILLTVRNNYLNGDFTTGAPPPAEPVAAMTDTDTEVVIRTVYPHAILDGEQVLIAGSTVPQMNDRFAVRWISETEFAILKPHAGSPPLGGNATAQRYVPKATPVNLNRIGPALRVTTRGPHWRKPGDWIRISGAILDDALDTRFFNGSFQVDTVPTPTSFTYLLYEDPGSGVGLGSAGPIWLDRWPSQMNIIPRNDGVLGLRGLPDGYGWVQTKTPHFRAPGDYIAISSVNGPPGAIWNGYFKVTEITNTRLLKCKLNTSTQPPDVPVDSNNFYQTAGVRYNFQGITVALGFGARAYGNRLVALNRGGPYHDIGPGPIRETINCYNYYDRCLIGQFSATESEIDRELWCTVHDNIVELQEFPLGAWNHEPPGGLLLWGPRSLPNHFLIGAHTFGSVFIYDNHVRFENGKPGIGSENGHSELGISVRWAKEALIQENVITLPLARNPLICQNVGVPKFINNLSDNGTAPLNGIP